MPGRPVIRLPRFPRLPDRLPLEDKLDRALNKVAQALEDLPITQKAREFEAKLPVVEGQDISTPLGTFRLPGLEAPSLAPPPIDDRRRETIKAALANDVTSLVEEIPVLGYFLGDFLNDTTMEKVLRTLTPEEYAIFKEEDKYIPFTSVAALRTFQRLRR